MGAFQYLQHPLGHEGNLVEGGSQPDPAKGYLRDQRAHLSGQALKKKLAEHKIGALRTKQELIDLLKDDDCNVRCLAAASLGKHRDVRAVEALVEMLGDELWPRFAAVEALAAIGLEQVIPHLRQMVAEAIRERYRLELDWPYQAPPGVPMSLRLRIERYLPAHD